MRKLARRVFVCGLLTVMLWCSCVISSGQPLMQEMIRFPVGTNSGTESGQNEYLQIWTKQLRQDIGRITDREAAKTYLQEILPVMRETAYSLDLNVRQGEVTEPVKKQIQFAAVKVLEYMENIFFAG